MLQGFGALNRPLWLAAPGRRVSEIVETSRPKASDSFVARAQSLVERGGFWSPNRPEATLPIGELGDWQAHSRKGATGQK
jgi:hypothetical protein